MLDNLITKYEEGKLNLEEEVIKHEEI